ncbi:MAG: hypothetical protein V3S69_03950 [Dehalococcoidales bacterium]
MKSLLPLILTVSFVISTQAEAGLEDELCEVLADLSVSAARLHNQGIDVRPSIFRKVPDPAVQQSMLWASEWGMNMSTNSPSAIYRSAFNECLQGRKYE